MITEHFPISDPVYWQRQDRWRRLPYARAIWAGPYGTTEYLASRDYNAIAYRGTDGGWRAAFGASLRRCAMRPETATYLWQPGRGQSPRVNCATLRDLLERCASHPATAWLLAGEGVR